MVNHPNWQGSDQLAIYKRGRGVKLTDNEKQILPVVRVRLEPVGTPGVQVQHPYYSA